MRKLLAKEACQKMKTIVKKATYLLLDLLIALVILVITLPTLLQSLDFHPDHEGKEFDLAGRKALVVTTSHGVLNRPGETDGPPTGVFASEMIQQVTDSPTFGRLATAYRPVDIWPVPAS